MGLRLLLFWIVCYGCLLLYAVYLVVGFGAWLMGCLIVLFGCWTWAFTGVAVWCSVYLTVLVVCLILGLVWVVDLIARLLTFCWC